MRCVCVEHPLIDILERVPDQCILCPQTCIKCNRPCALIEVAPNVFSGWVIVDGTLIEATGKHIRVAHGEWIANHHVDVIRAGVHVFRLTGRSL